MKFIIHRSYAGFGDRLSQLCFCIEIAIKTKRILVVDWRDNIWAGNDEKKDFYYYFTLKNVPHITYERFLEITKKIKINSVWPFKWKKWENCKLDGTEDDYMAFLVNVVKNYKSKVNKEVLNQYNILSKEIETIDIKDPAECFIKKQHDVILWQDIKCNYPAKCLLFSHIKFNENVIEFINKDVNSFIIRNKLPYITVHLRGTDRSNNDNKTLKNNSDNPETYINNIIEKLDTSKCNNIMLLTDSIILKDKFIELYNDTFNIIVNSTVLSNNDKAIHSQLENKIINNLHMLKDYNYLIKSINIYNDGISYFSNTAKIIQNTMKVIEGKKVIDDEVCKNITNGIQDILANPVWHY